VPSLVHQMYGRTHFSKAPKHRLVRVIAKNRPILGDRSIDCSTPTTRVHHHGDGPGLEIGPQIAPGPKRPIQSADRSPAMWVAPIQPQG
jgi:hypothetical protein